MSRTAWRWLGALMWRLPAAQVLDFELQRQLVPYMKEYAPLPGIYDPDFIAANQDTRADNVVSGSKKEQLETIQRDIRAFKEQSQVCELFISVVRHRLPPAKALFIDRASGRARFTGSPPL